MTALELKQRLIMKINQTQDNEILEDMYCLIANKDTDNNIYELSDEQKNAVVEGHLQFKTGSF